MIDLIDNYYSSNDTYNNSNNTDIDSQKISKNAISSVLPLILKNDYNRTFNADAESMQ